MSAALATKVSYEVTHQIQDYIQDTFRHHESPNCETSTEDHPGVKKLKTDSTDTPKLPCWSFVEDPDSNPLSFVGESIDVKRESLKVLSNICSDILVGLEQQEQEDCRSNDCTDSHSYFSCNLSRARKPDSRQICSELDEQPHNFAVCIGDLGSFARSYSHPSFRFPVSSICAVRNCRKTMEDRHVLLHDLNAVCDFKVSFFITTVNKIIEFLSRNLQSTSCCHSVFKLTKYPQKRQEKYFLCP